MFFGRFVAVLRTLAALSAGINQMSWWRFNALGGITWATVFGVLAYLFGTISGIADEIGIVFPLSQIVRQLNLAFDKRPETD